MLSFFHYYTLPSILHSVYSKLWLSFLIKASFQKFLQLFEIAEHFKFNQKFSRKSLNNFCHIFSANRFSLFNLLFTRFQFEPFINERIIRKAHNECVHIFFFVSRSNPQLISIFFSIPFFSGFFVFVEKKQRRRKIAENFADKTSWRSGIYWKVSWEKRKDKRILKKLF